MRTVVGSLHPVASSYIDVFHFSHIAQHSHVEVDKDGKAASKCKPCHAQRNLISKFSNVHWLRWTFSTRALRLQQVLYDIIIDVTAHPRRIAPDIACVCAHILWHYVSGATVSTAEGTVGPMHGTVDEVDVAAG